MDHYHTAKMLSAEAVMEELFEKHAVSSGETGYRISSAQKSSYMDTFRAVPIFGRLLPRYDAKKALVDKLVEEQKYATTYKKWYDISVQLDELLNNNSWKQNPRSDFYDHELIFKNMMEMREARSANDYKLLLYLIRTKWTRDLGNMGDINLYRHSYVGTKELIEEYFGECQLALDYLINDPEVNLDDRYLLGMLVQTRKNIGRTALMLSGGSTFGIFHIGVLATLLEANLLPRIICGSSAGSIMASILCCNTNEEVCELLKGITERKFNIFGELLTDDGSLQQNNFKKLLYHLSHFLKYGTFFDTTGLKGTVCDFIGDLTFREAYNRTGKILNITVSPASMHEQTRLLNYLTAPNCLVWSAVCASCSLPGVFPSTSIYEKTPGTGQTHEWNNDSSMKYVDGSVENDLPITRLSEMFNVDHIIAVQVNPHVVPILRASINNVGGEVENHVSNRLKYFLNNVYDFMTSEVIHYLQLLNEMDIYKNLSNKMISVLSQNYSGDITICADYKPVDFLKLFENPSTEFLLDFIVRGARAAWPKITVIKNHCGVEFALDKAITLMRGRVIISASSSLNAENEMLSKMVKSTSTSILKTYKNGNGLNSSVTSVTTNSSPKAERKQRSTIQRVHSSYGQNRNSVHMLNPVSRNNSRKKMTRGKSTTALASMPSDQGYGYDALVTDESTAKWKLNDMQLRDTELNERKRHDLDDSKPDARQSVRKAKSSINFQSPVPTSPKKTPSLVSEFSNLKKSADNFEHNPYFESFSPRTTSPEKVAIAPYPGAEDKMPSLPASGEKKANLPTISSRPTRNSYIALNRLKESNIRKSENGSSQNLRNAINNPPSPVFLRGDISTVPYSFFNASDNDDDLVDWDHQDDHDDMYSGSIDLPITQDINPSVVCFDTTAVEFSSEERSGDQYEYEDDEDDDDEDDEEIDGGIAVRHSEREKIFSEDDTEKTRVNTSTDSLKV